jgi:hypothetical protein
MNSYRAANGRLAAGVPKNFSEETLSVLRERLDRARMRRASKRSQDEARLEKQRKEHADYVEAMALAGKFVPMQSWE